MVHQYRTDTAMPGPVPDFIIAYTCKMESYSNNHIPEIIPLQRFRSPFLTVPHVCDNVLVEFRLMAYEKNAAFVSLERSLKLILGVNVKVVGRLVEKQKISLMVDKLAQTNLCLLAAA